MPVPSGDSVMESGAGVHRYSGIPTACSTPTAFLMSASQTGEPSPSRITSDLAAIPAGYDHPETPIPNNAASRTDEDGVVALHRGTRRCLPP